MPARLEKLWINTTIERQEIRFDWSNDRHHAVAIEPPYGPAQIAKALSDASWLIGGDPHLVGPNAN